MELQKSGHSVYRNQYHIVWIPKYRRRILNPGLRSYCTKVLKSELRSMSGVKLKEQTLREDHIHIVLIIPPKYRVADVIGRLKAKTAGALRDKFDWLADVYWKENIVWSPGYFVTTFGIDESIVLDYVRHQADQDSPQEYFLAPLTAQSSFAWPVLVPRVYPWVSTFHPVKYDLR